MKGGLKWMAARRTTFPGILVSATASLLVLWSLLRLADGWPDVPLLVSFLVALTVSLWVAATVGVVTMQRQTIYPFWEVDPLPQTPLPGFVRVETKAADGCRTVAWWRPPEDGKPVVVSFHGSGTSIAWHSLRFSRPPWSDVGVLCPAWRGYPGSDGRPSERGILADAEACVAKVREMAPTSPILFHGHSLGTSAAVQMAAAHDCVGLYVEAPFASVLGIAQARIRWLPAGFVAALLLDHHRSDEAMARVTVPVMVVHGDRDRIVPSWSGRRLADAAGGEASFREIEGDHNSIFGALDVEAVRRFVGP